MANLIGSTSEASIPGVRGENTNNTPAAGVGVHGKSNAAGVLGESPSWHGVAGLSQSTIGGAGVYGQGLSGNYGVLGESTTGGGTEGRSQSGPGVFGRSKTGAGVFGQSTEWIGVYGETAGIESGPAGVWGEHKGAGVGVKAVSKDGAGLAAYNLNPDSTGAAIFAKKEGTQGHAGFFDGNVLVSGELRVGKDIILENADCAEDFDIAEAEIIESGTVMVVGEEGALHRSHQAYDKRVAGVISGAGDYKPGIVLDKQHSQPNRKPIALLGKVYCKVDAGYAPIGVGDLLTTSGTPGHAMKAADPLKAFGAVIGKALRPLREGQGLIPILIALQ